MDEKIKNKGWIRYTVLFAGMLFFGGGAEFSFYSYILRENPAACGGEVQGIDF